jgi:predicted DCC family thiol-disulfide oxidoreductase YuxK
MVMVLHVIYDETCPLCRNSRRYAEAMDWFHRLVFVGMTDEAFIRTHFPGLDEACLAEAMHVIDRRGRAYRGFAAFRRILRVNPLAWPLALLLYLPGVSLLGDRTYRRIAARRHCRLE